MLYLIRGGSDEMKTLGENIRKLRQVRGLTQQQLADKMGASNYTTISKWESGANSPRGGDLVELSKLFNVSVDELLGINSNVTLKTNYKFIPTAISAGLPIEVDGITETKKISIPDSLMGKWAGNKDIFIMKVNGESMNNVMPHGSLIAVKPIEAHQIKDGDIVVYSDGGDYSVKRFYRDENRLIFRPDSSDPSFYDYVTDINNDELIIHGKVVVYIVELD